MSHLWMALCQKAQIKKESHPAGVAPRHEALTDGCVLGDAEKGHVAVVAAGSLVIEVGGVVRLPFTREQQHTLL